jgi:hypothetical protein
MIVPGQPTMGGGAPDRAGTMIAGKLGYRFG